MKAKSENQKTQNTKHKFNFQNSKNLAFGGTDSKFLGSGSRSGAEAEPKPKINDRTVEIKEMKKEEKERKKKGRMGLGKAVSQVTLSFLVVEMIPSPNFSFPSHLHLHLHFPSFPPPSLSLFINPHFSSFLFLLFSSFNSPRSTTLTLLSPRPTFFGGLASSSFLHSFLHSFASL